MRLLHSQSTRANFRTLTLVAAITALMLAMVAPFVGTAEATANKVFAGFINLSNGETINLGDPEVPGTWTEGSNNVTIPGYQWQGATNPEFHLSCSQTIGNTQVKVTATDEIVTIEEFAIYRGNAQKDDLQSLGDPLCTDDSFEDEDTFDPDVTVSGECVGDQFVVTLHNSASTVDASFSGTLSVNGNLINVGPYPVDATKTFEYKDTPTSPTTYVLNWTASADGFDDVTGQENFSAVDCTQDTFDPDVTVSGQCVNDEFVVTLDNSASTVDTSFSGTLSVNSNTINVGPYPVEATKTFEYKDTPTSPTTYVLNWTASADGFDDVTGQENFSAVDCTSPETRQINVEKLWFDSDEEPIDGPSTESTSLQIDLTVDGGDDVSVDEGDFDGDWTTTQEIPVEASVTDVDESQEPNGFSRTTDSTIDERCWDPFAQRETEQEQAFLVTVQPQTPTYYVCNIEDDTPPPPPPPTGNWDLTVDKSVLDSRTPTETETFEFEVVCDDELFDTLVIEGDGTDTADNIPDGAECTVTETDTADADTTSVGLVEGDLEDGATIDLGARSTDETVYFENTFSEVLAEIIEPAATIDADCGGVVVDLDNTGSTMALDFVVDINGTEQTITVPAGGTDQVTGPLAADDSWVATVTVDDNDVATDSGQEDCTVPPTIAPTATVDADCEDGVLVTLDNRGSDVAVTYTVVINGDEQQVTVPGGTTRTVEGDLDNGTDYDVTVTADGMDPVTAQDQLTCVQGVVLDREPALAATGVDHVRMLGLAMAIAALGAMLLLGTGDRRRRSES